MKFRKTVTSLLIGAIVLPMLITLLLGLSLVVGAMGDGNGPVILRAVSIALGFLWIVDLMALLIVLAVAYLLTPNLSAIDDES